MTPHTDKWVYFFSAIAVFTIVCVPDTYFKARSTASNPGPSHLVTKPWAEELPCCLWKTELMHTRTTRFVSPDLSTYTRASSNVVQLQNYPLLLLPKSSVNSLVVRNSWIKTISTPNGHLVRFYLPSTIELWNRTFFLFPLSRASISWEQIHWQI